MGLIYARLESRFGREPKSRPLRLTLAVRWPSGLDFDLLAGFLTWKICIVGPHEVRPGFAEPDGRLTRQSLSGLIFSVLDMLTLPENDPDDFRPFLIPVAGSA